MQADVIGLGEEFIQADELGAGNFFDVGIISHHGHPEGHGASDDGLADIAHTDQAEGFPANFIAFEGFLFPFFGFHRAGSLVERAGEHEHVTNRQFGHRIGGGQRGILDGDALAARVFNVNGVEAHAAADDQLQVRANVDQRLADLGAGADDSHIIGWENGHQIFGGDFEIGIHRQTGGAHRFDAFFFGFIAD